MLILLCRLFILKLWGSQSSGEHCTIPPGSSLCRVLVAVRSQPLRSTATQTGQPHTYCRAFKIDTVGNVIIEQISLIRISFLRRQQRKVQRSKDQSESIHKSQIAEQFVNTEFVYRQTSLCIHLYTHLMQVPYNGPSERNCMSDAYQFPLIFFHMVESVPCLELV